MRWYIRHFYDVGLALAVVVLGVGVILQMDTLQTILLLNFALVLLHEFEEYHWPGGFPYFLNGVMLNSDDPPRWRLNQLSSFILNVPAAYIFYVLPVFFPHVIWLGLAPVLFNFAEGLLHGIAATARARAAYNPGLITVVPWLAVSIWYIYEINSRGLAAAADWWIAVAYVVVFVVIFLGLLTYVILPNRNSTFPFADEELSRFERYRRLVGAAHPH